MHRVLWTLVFAAALPLLALAGLLAGSEWLNSLEAQVEARFEAPLGALPSRVYAQPLRLRPGTDLERAGAETQLEIAGYRRVTGVPARGGEFTVAPREWTIWHRARHGPDGAPSDGLVTLRLDRRGRVAKLIDGQGRPLDEARIEPARIGTFHADASEERDPVRLGEVPPHLVDAILAVEDQRFFDHGGLDLRRVAGALTANLRAGRVVQGGSTITQQLVKNLFLSPRRTLARKVREALMAIVVERNHGKQEILEAYLNEVYLGQSGPLAIHGVGSAARHFFAKPAAELDLVESALLAGILRGPSLYSPFRKREAARERRDLVLGLLHEQGKLPEAAYREALETPIRLRTLRELPRSASYFVDFLHEQLAERYGAEALAREGFLIHTTLDLRLQSLAEQAVARGVARLEQRSEHLRREHGPLEAALVALDPRTGSILAMVGGREYATSQFNRAVQARRQPGSVFKPVVALAALSRQGGQDPAYTLASVLEDAPIEIPALEGLWTPGNHDRTFRGAVTLREAIEESLNVPMARLGQALGLRRVISTARRLGVESPLRSVPSLALGTYEVTLLEMTRAYATLAAEGRRPELRGVLAIADRTGEELERIPVRRARVFDPAEAYLVTSALEGTVNRGTGSALRALGVRGPVAGKTGTTDDYRDAWFIGYTPEIVVGVWVGFDDGTSLKHSGARAALPIFADFLGQAIGSRGGAGFRRPPGIERVSVVAEAGHRAGLRCSGAPEVFLSGTEPLEGCGAFRWWALWDGGAAPSQADRGRPVVRTRPEAYETHAGERERPARRGARRERWPRWKFPLPFGR